MSVNLLQETNTSEHFCETTELLEKITNYLNKFNDGTQRYHNFCFKENDHRRYEADSFRDMYDDDFNESNMFKYIELQFSDVLIIDTYNYEDYSNCWKFDDRSAKFRNTKTLTIKHFQMLRQIQYDYPELDFDVIFATTKFYKTGTYLCLQNIGLYTIDSENYEDYVEHLQNNNDVITFYLFVVPR